MRFSTVVPAFVVLLASSAFAQEGLVSALGSAVASAAEGVQSDAVASVGDSLGLPSNGSTSTPSASATESVTVNATVLPTNGTSHVNATSTLSSILPSGSGNGTNGTSDAMSLGIHVLPGIAAIGAIAYSGIFGL